jgi:hypothetical protein
VAEPLLLEYAVDHQVGVQFSTNGVRITPERARFLASTDYVDVQISLDGATAEVNDYVRGPGSYDTAIRALANLQDAGFKDARSRWSAPARTSASSCRSTGIHPGCTRLTVMSRASAYMAAKNAPVGITRVWAKELGGEELQLVEVGPPGQILQGDLRLRTGRVGDDRRHRTRPRHR